MAIEYPSGYNFTRIKCRNLLEVTVYKCTYTLFNIGEHMAYPILKHFSYDHLPADLQLVSKPIAELAKKMADALPGCAETSAGLRHLLEAKDCFVRANLEERPTEENKDARL
jgi:hypothetical protein